MGAGVVTEGHADDAGLGVLDGGAAVGFGAGVQAGEKLVSDFFRSRP